MRTERPTNVEVAQPSGISASLAAKIEPRPLRIVRRHAVVRALPRSRGTAPSADVCPDCGGREVCPSCLRCVRFHCRCTAADARLGRRKADRHSWGVSRTAESSPGRELRVANRGGSGDQGRLTLEYRLQPDLRRFAG